MLRSPWRRLLHRSSHRSATRRSRRRCNLPAIVAGVQRLEDRTLLTNFLVNSTLDTPDAALGDGVAQDANGNTTLRAAIMEANALGGADVITLPAGTYNLTRSGANEDAALTGDLDITDHLTIVGGGSGGTRIDATGLGDRIFDVAEGSSTDNPLVVSIEGVTVTGGRLLSAFPSNRGGAMRIDFSTDVTLSDTVFVDNGIANTDSNSGVGGAIVASGVLTIENSRFEDNFANNSGGALYLGGNIGTSESNRNLIRTHIRDTTFTGNTAPGGGAILVQSPVTIENSTFVGNTANSGGAIEVQSSVFASLDMSNSTVSGNQANFGGGVMIFSTSFTNSLRKITSSTITNNTASRGGGLRAGTGTNAIIENSIIAGNHASTSGPDVDNAVTSQGHNLIGDTTDSSGFGAAGDLLNVNPLLGPLAGNGGPTLTHALLPGSPAIDAANTATSPATDQRGVARPQGAAADIGSFEWQATPEIRGSIWDDRDGDGVRDAGEPDLSGRTVFLDANNNGLLDAGEESTVTDASGDYAFSELADGTYFVRQVLPDGWRQSFPDVSGTGGTLLSLSGHRDLVFDETRDILYVTMSDGTVQRYDVAAGTLLSAFSVGTSLNGADITPDGNALYVAENDRTGVLYKVDLADGSTVELTYTPGFGEAGSYDVAVGSGGKGLFTARFSGSGSVQLREFDLATDAIAQRRSIQQDTQIHRSDDRATFFLTESNISSGPIFAYDAAADTFSSTAETNTFLGGVLSAVNRDGSLIATEIGGLSIMDSDFNAVETLSGVVGGVFDPTKDVLYALDAVSDQVVAFDTNTWNELLRFDIGENLLASTSPLGGGTTQISDDGRFLFLSTASGVRIYDLVALTGGQVVTVAGSVGTGDVDFGSFEPATPDVSVDDLTVTEGNSGATNATFTVSLSTASQLPVSVRYLTADDSAELLGGDYTPMLGVLNFAPGETSKTVSVQVTGDAVDELDERFFLTLYAAVNANIADGQGTATITNDDSGTRGEIRGTKFDDRDGDGMQDSGEPGLSDWRIFVDLNNNGEFDDVEPSTLTDADGNYALTNLPIGQTYTVAEVPQAGWEQTTPLGHAGVGLQRLIIPVPDARDLIYDPLREILYITTASGNIERYDVNESRLLTPLEVGGSLNGADITSDGRSLYVAEGLRNVTQSMLRKVNLADGSVTNLPFDHAFFEAGAWDIAIGAGSKALLTSGFAGSGWVPLRELDLGSDTLSIRTPTPGSGFRDEVRQNTHIYRGEDRSTFLFAESNISSGPIFTYDAVADDFLGQRNTSTFLSNALGSVSRDGSIVAIEDGFDVSLFHRDLSTITTLASLGGGVMFDPAHDVLWTVDDGSDELVAFDTNSFSELFRESIGTSVSASTPFRNGVLAASPDGRQLFLSNGRGTTGEVLMFRLIVDSHRVALTGSVVEDIDFGNLSDNIAPTAGDDEYRVLEDNTLTVDAPGVLRNDSDVDGDSLTAVLVAGPSNGTLTLNADGSFSYTPNADFNGSDSFTYRANDGSLDSNLATVLITVVPVNDAPTAADDSYGVDEDNALTVNAPGALANDNDVDGDSMTAVLVAGPSNGELTLNADGSFSYTPNADFNGSDSFTYRASDGSLSSNVATVTITVNAVNDAPTATGDAYSVDEDNALTVNAPGALANDNDVDGDSITAVLDVGPSNGTLTLNADGSFSYTPNADFNGSDSFTYHANDGSLDSNVATVTITVNAVNDAPTAAGDAYSVDEDNTLTVNAPGVLANDSDVDGDSITAVLVAGPSNGTLTLNADGSFSYTPGADFNGSDSFTYRANDGDLNSDVATVTITVNAVNDAPTAAGDAYSVDEDNTLNIAAPGVLANDSDVDGDSITAVLDVGPSNGTLTLNADGSFSYTPSADFNGSDSFTYRANDGSLDSNVATVTITVNAVNDAPTATGDAYSVDEDTPLNIAAAGVLANDSDVDGDSITAVLDIGPSNGTLTLNADGSFSYTPVADFNGSDSFTYHANDGSLNSDVATVTITVNAVNDGPTATGDAYSVDEDNTLTVDAPGVLANDSDVDGDSLTAVLDVGPSNGTLTLNADGSFSYTPNADFNGSDSFTYHANDGSLDSNVATVSITVNAVNDGPAVDDQAFSIPENSANGTSVGTIAASDPDAGDTLTFAVTGGSGATAFAVDEDTGEITVADASQLDYETTPTFVLDVLVTDAAGLTDTAAVTIRLSDVNESTDVVIDVAPGDDSNTVNINSGGKIEVAILSTAGFDALSVDVNSLTFGRIGDEASLSRNPGSGVPRYRIADVNGDGRLDIVVRFEIELTGFQVGDEEGVLRGLTRDGAAFEARQFITIKDPGNGHGKKNRRDSGLDDLFGDSGFGGMFDL